MKKYLIVSAFLAAAACAVCAQTEPAAQQAASAIKVEKAVTAASVADREPVGETSAFDNATTKVYVWTRITAEQVPVTIKHVYYHEGKMVREIPLSVKSSPYRVWSAKNVVPGNWKVDVTDEDGNVLASLVFTVAAEAAPEIGK